MPPIRAIPRVNRSPSPRHNWLDFIRYDNEKLAAKHGNAPVCNWVHRLKTVGKTVARLPVFISHSIRTTAFVRGDSLSLSLSLLMWRFGTRRDIDSEAVAAVAPGTH